MEAVGYTLTVPVLGARRQKVAPNVESHLAANAWLFVRVGAMVRHNKNNPTLLRETEVFDERFCL
jgi:hypothetical protein